MDLHPGQPETAAKLAGAELIPALLAEFLPVLTPGLPTPKVQVVDTPGAAALARCVWVPGEDNTTLKIQKAVLGDTDTLRRIIAHELCHHDEFLTRWAKMPDRQREILMRIDTGHGPYFKMLADKFNARFGSNFVTERSDSAMVIDDGRTYFVLLRSRPNGRISWAWALRPSARQREYLEGVLHAGLVHGHPVDTREYKLVQSRDNVFSQGPTIGKGLAYTNDAGVNEKLQTLWTEAPALAKTAALDAHILDGADEVAHVSYRPRLGYHYEIIVVKANGTFTGQMARTDQEFVAPPFRLEATSIGDLTQAVWGILDEGYRVKMDAARRAGDSTLRAQLYLEQHRAQQELMADIEKAFRKMPSGPRNDWSQPWDFNKEGSAMAYMRRSITRATFIEHFKAQFPTWTVETTGNELMAVGPENPSWEQIREETKKLQRLSQEMQVSLVSRPQRGRFVVTVNLTGLSQ